ncbi:uncharacterized protein BDW43DRAFT_302568 [Aspergillus alliaceus]|uniref:uncharacterized protein n=1 Tax=Petromyces alliaceus TaxID=209559 RepID=UPI0012A47A45|nr:uncharacterized protein BDW43DRAFT_302568 [Aspergillus alliaceus]KAB8230303.1 hypothetical protein BDW43DRAFT_302568 [Aspergillus alliaceus]
MLSPTFPHPDPNGSGTSRATWTTSRTPEAPRLFHPHQGSIQRNIIAFYSGGALKDDMKVYGEQAIYDDPFSYCDTRCKIAGQWQGVPKLFAKSETLATEITSSTEHELVWKAAAESANSLISLTLEGNEPNEKVVYHKDIWNSRDCSHDGLEARIKKLNGDRLTNITRPSRSV